MIEADRRKRLDALEAYLRSSPKAITPQRVYEETVTEPKSLGYLATSASRIEKLYKNSTMTIENPDYSDRKISDVVDKVRECIAKKAKKPVHLVERADLQIVALAVSYANRGKAVELIFRDKALKDCLVSVLVGRGISGVAITDSSKLVRELVSRK